MRTHGRNGLKFVTVYPKKYAHGFCFAVLCCGYTLTDFPISIRLTSLALWQSNDCPSASKATLMNMDKYFMWIHYDRLHNHNKAKHNKTVCIFLGIYCMQMYPADHLHWSDFGQSVDRPFLSWPLPGSVPIRLAFVIKSVYVEGALFCIHHFVLAVKCASYTPCNCC